MWEKRVHITNIVHKAYVKACKNYNFEKNAAKVGMRMTTDGSGDELINLQCVGHVSFSDADGGEPPEYSEEEEEEDEDEEKDEYEDSVDLVSLSSEEEDDDTAEKDAAAATAVGDTVAPEGFELDDRDLGHENNVIGRNVLMKWDGAPLGAVDFGWY